VEFERTLQAALGAARVSAGLLEIEITESTLMETSREHNDLLARMRSSGLRIAIDDFGTGYSSLDYLRRFPVDRIKIAQNFTSGIGRSEGSTVIVKAAVGLARALGMDVIAEGAETAQQVRLLGEWGCREVQGYFYAQPATRPAIDQLLARGRIEGAGTGQREAVITPATGAAWAST
jgi:EAL domain-containing protein (putative c-di-GMP-specific phosphodiesterase class I)